MGRGPKTEQRRSIVLLATYGWWPWLLMYALILIVVAGVIAYFVKRRRAV
jgi:hypothetical protein